MKITKKLGICLFLALIVWGIEALYLLQRNVSVPAKISSEAKRKQWSIAAGYQSKERKLREEYDRKKYQATGKTVYDRIFNTPNQSIVELIQRIAKESLPASWDSEVKVEEFSHFILLIYLPHNSGRVPASKVAAYLGPVLKYCDSYISNIAVFDRTHKAYLFFDKDILEKVKDNKGLGSQIEDKIATQGDSFTRFNSVVIQCEKQDSHLFLPVEIIGPIGVKACYMLFDTGASVTTISEEIARSTGRDNLATAPTKSFNTANGWMSCSIVHRKVNVGGFYRDIEVAVNKRDELNLLGMNYFEGMDYIVDFQNSCIYAWEKSD